MEALEPEQPDQDDARLVRREVNLVAAPGIVVTVHRGPIVALDRFVDDLAEDTTLGLLDAGDLLSALVDQIINGYLVLVEDLEREIDALDAAALGDGDRVDILGAIVALRRRIAIVRRVLAPHRSALAALARPEMDATNELGRPWPGLPDRIENVLSAVESLRDSLLGTYDIHMGRSAQHANDVMKALTVLSAVLLPAVVLAGIMGMNFELPFFDQPANFYLVVLAMIVFAVALLAVTRWRRWW